MTRQEEIAHLRELQSSAIRFFSQEERDRLTNLCEAEWFDKFSEAIRTDTQIKEIDLEIKNLLPCGLGDPGLIALMDDKCVRINQIREDYGITTVSDGMD